VNTPASPSHVGATALPGGGWRFRVWAPAANRVDLQLKYPVDRVLRMRKDSAGFHNLKLEELAPETTYLYRLDDQEEWPDPASRSQPHGVHGPSQIIDPQSFRWKCARWKPLSLPSAVLYELHVGTYTPEGTFDAVIAHLGDLADLGVTTIEIMPVAQFPGSRNWGYDGVYIYAPQNSYGGPAGLQRLVDAAHARGLTVVLDVVYNHLGPEGNYLGKFGRYFTTRYRTPWGSALNFDGPDSGPVRDFFISNALYWLEQFRIDGLRLDAIDRIYDLSAHHFLAELKESVQQLEKRTGRKIVLIAESDLNNRRILDPPDRGGYALDAQWSDDFHHALHTLLIKETAGYYADFGTLEHLANTLRQGWYYEGQYSAFRRRNHGNSPRGISAQHFVVCSQNHDQVGNRAMGDRLSGLVDLAGLKLAAGVTLLSPFVPMLFMGEEYGEPAPFLYFTSHDDADLVEAVRQGRQAEFAVFGWPGQIPDPQSATTFREATLQHSRKNQHPHTSLWSFYRELIALRAKYCLGQSAAIDVTAHEPEKVLVVFRKTSPALMMIFHFGAANMQFSLALPRGNWRIVLDSTDHSGAVRGERHREASLSGSFAPTPITLDLLPRSFLVLENTTSPGE
jgi:maltooligosyltrehalose trehalohydrolase